MSTLFKSTMFFALCLVFCQVGIAQNFLEATESFSRNKDAYITLNDGNEIVAKFRNVKTKKGLFLKVYVDDGNSKKREILAEDIQHMYLPASSWDKMAKASRLSYDVTKWDDDSSLNQELVMEGYAFFETVEVKIKKKTKTALMQLLNPAYANKIRVYNNPYSTETAGLSYKGLQVTGGDTKSYYIKVGDNEAKLLKKKDYSKVFDEMYGDCKSFLKENTKKRWKDLEKNVFDHANACAE